MKAGIRTPAEVIGLALEDNGVESELIDSISHEIEKRLAKALQSVSIPGAEVVVYSHKRGSLSWGTVEAKNDVKVRSWTLPSRQAGEGDWDWCVRSAESIPAEELMRMVVAYFDRREKQRRSPTWSIISKITSHGSTVSEAIARRFRAEKGGS